MPLIDGSMGRSTNSLCMFLLSIFIFDRAPRPPSLPAPHTSAPDFASRVLRAPPSSAPPASPFLAPGGPSASLRLPRPSLAPLCSQLQKKIPSSSRAAEPGSLQRAPRRDGWEWGQVGAPPCAPWAVGSPLKPHNPLGRREVLVSEPWKLREEDKGGRNHRPTRNCPGLWKAPKASLSSECMFCPAFP